MTKNVKFALMQYIPNFERDEKINVGVILHSPSDEYMKIKVISNFKRLKEFDDEIDLNFMKVYFKSLEKSFTYDSLNLNQIDIRNFDLLDQLTSIYVNQFTFKIYDMTIESSCDVFLEKLKDNYLYFDVNKEKRVSQKESIDFFAELLRGKNVTYEIVGNKNCLLGNYDEKINVDFKIKDKYYKIINFNNDNIDRYTPTIKMWMLNAIELKDNKQEIIFVVNEQILNEKTEIFIKMLGKYAKVIKVSEFNQYF